jgi:hypothetical protein
MKVTLDEEFYLVNFLVMYLQERPKTAEAVAREEL